MEREILTFNRKALRINLKHTTYRALAEIGREQEVAYWFFPSGGYMRTEVKSILTINKCFSGYIYNQNKPERYTEKPMSIKSYLGLNMIKDRN